MKLATIDKEGKASQLASQAEQHLARGETARAAELFKEAGEVLERQTSTMRRPGEANLTRFLAATQYWKGGHYEEAARVCKAIRERSLPVDVRHLYAPFLRDITERARPDYRRRIGKTLLEEVRRKAYSTVLRTLQDHPFVLTQEDLAFLRATCCEHLKDYRAATVFYADAIKFATRGSDLVVYPAGYALTLAIPETLSEAWEYIQYQLQAFTHPLPPLVASLIRYHQAIQASSSEEQQRLFEDQLRYCATGRERFGSPPAEHPESSAWTTLARLALEAAALTQSRLGDKPAAVRLCEEAMSLAPDDPELLMLRGFITYPDPSGVEDSREATRRGAHSYLPYCVLAHAALVEGDFRSADSLCHQALAWNPPAQVQADLLQWQAMARSHLGRSPEEVRSLFVAAAALAPDNVLIRQNRDIYEKWLSAARGSSPAYPRPPRDAPSSLEDYFPTRERAFRESWEHSSHEAEVLEKVG